MREIRWTSASAKGSRPVFSTHSVERTEESAPNCTLFERFPGSYVQKTAVQSPFSTLDRPEKAIRSLRGPKTPSKVRIAEPVKAEVSVDELKRLTSDYVERLKSILAGREGESRLALQCAVQREVQSCAEISPEMKLEVYALVMHAVRVAIMENSRESVQTPANPLESGKPASSDFMADSTFPRQ